MITLFYPSPADIKVVTRVIDRLLSAGADLNCRTAWGDTAAHYSGRWSSIEVLSHLLEKGIEVDKDMSEGWNTTF